jgi:DNA uptake protein ComE-like DNA-binding protein/endonuclease/exonuclease/phosphatase family metal-dependent hydrolase
MADPSANTVPSKLSVADLKKELKALNLPVSGSKPELVNRLVDARVNPLNVAQLKEQLLAHGQPGAGKKEELALRLRSFLAGVQTPLKESLPNDYKPASLSFVDLKKLAKDQGVPQSGRHQDLLKAVATDAVDELTPAGIKAALAARGLPVAGKEAELKTALITALSLLPAAVNVEKVVDINHGTVAELSALAGIGPTLAERIVANRPYTSLLNLISKVKNLGPEILKPVAHLLTGWAEPEISANSDSVGLNGDNEVAAQERKDRKEFLLASWNIRNISNKKTDENLKKIASLVAQFDFLSVQEVRDVEVMHRLKNILGPHWEVIISEQIGTEHHKERYAFMYRNTVISVVSKPELLVDTCDVFVREPFIGYFKAGVFDFIVSTIHIVWGDSILGRRAEIEKLDGLLKSLQKVAGAEKDLIICGDFNMPPVDVCWGIDGWQALIQPPQKTVVGDSSLYDNIWISAEHTGKSEWKGSAGCIEFDKLMYEGPRGKHDAINQVSDHRPVWALFSTEIDDDAQINVDLKNLRL